MFVSQSGVPLTLTTGTDFKPLLVFKNSGTTPWTAASNYVLRSRNPDSSSIWNTSTLLLPNAVDPGGSVTFSPTFTAPSVPGTYNFQWSMMHVPTMFGDLSTPVSIVVTQGPNTSQYVTETAVPTSIGPGVHFGVSFTMKNLGTATWDPSYSLVSRNPWNNTNWGLSNLPIVGSVSPGAQTTVTANLTAPSTPGTYHFRWRMSVNGVPFGQETPDILVTVSADAATYVSQSVPTSCFAGDSIPIQLKFKNTGVTTWSSTTGYWAISQGPNAASWGSTQAQLPAGSIIPGGIATLSPVISAPAIPGTYTMQWRMSVNNVGFGEKTPAVTIQVLDPGSENAQYVSESVPNTAVAGQQFAASITYKNVGTADWPANVALACLSPTLGTRWGFVVIRPGSVVTKGSTKTFTIDALAPYTPGSYTFQFRMRDLNTNTWFGDVSVAKTISVTAGPYAQSAWPGSMGGRWRGTSRGCGSGAIGTLLWSRQFTPSNSWPSLALGADGTLYTPGADNRLYAIDRMTGATQWSSTFNVANGSTPCVGANGTIYASNSVVAIDPATHAPLWTSFGYGLSRGVHLGPNGNLYVATGPRLLCLNPATGSQIWSFQVDSGGNGAGIWGEPAFGTNGLVYVGSTGKKIYAINAATGAEVWEFLTGANVENSAAIGADGTVYMGSNDGYLYALEGNTGTLKWKFHTYGLVATPAIAADGTVYCGDSTLYALNGSTGALKWTFGPGPGGNRNVVIGADGTLYFGTASKRLYAVDGYTGAAKWSYLADSYLNTPVIAEDGTVYVTSGGGYIYALK